MRREREIFKVNRGYKELVERLDIERIDDIEYLPCDVISTAANDDNVDNEYLPCDENGVVADDNNDEIITYLIVTNNMKGDMTIPNVDKFYDIIMWNNPVHYYYGIMVTDENLNSHYIKISVWRNMTSMF